MKTQQIQQPRINVGRSFPRQGWWLGLSLLLVVGLGLYAVVQGASGLTGGATAFVAQTDPATAGVMNYIRVHASIPDRGLPLSPEAQSVADYLRVHSTTVQQPALDAAARGVADYIQAHSNVSTGAAVDPAVPGVMNYIRVHASIPDHALTVDPSVQSVTDYLRAHGN